MFSKLNIQEIIEGHRKSFLDKNKKNTIGDFLAYKFFPFALAILFVILKIPDNNVLNIFGICLSILIGLFLNILVLLTANISSERLNISSTQKQNRLALLEETLYNVSFSVVLSVKALIMLFLTNIVFISVGWLDQLCYLIFSYKFNYVLSIIFGFFLYKYSIEIFLTLYMILKRINKLFSNEITVEKLKIDELRKEEEND